MNFNKANLLAGWIIFLIASVVYLITIEPTASFWDCGEFIATAYKLEIGHPPGAPLFMLLGRLFSMFVPTAYVPVTINVLSALCSSFTILFLFWTITHFGRKIALKNTADQLLTQGQIIAIIGSGAVGALAYTFSDSFWFSAAEGEVYAMSSLFTAVVFWAILKWESLSNGTNEMRWIILIAYLMGLSIGVHLLNLLAIPAICFVFYFKRYKPSTKGIVITALLSMVILGIVQAIIIPGVVSLAGSFELLFVNTMGLPFNTGIVVYALLACGALIWALRYTARRQFVVAHTSLVALLVIILGYSTFATIVIRSSANPPLDENNPENVFTLLSYLNREQYGDRPLLYGHYWNSPADPGNERSDGEPLHAKAYVVKNKGGRTLQWFTSRFDAERFIAEQTDRALIIEEEYVVSDDRKDAIVNFDPRFEVLFPRMYSQQESHISAYKSWSDYVGTPVRAVGADGNPTIINKPTWGENLKFFFRYQLNWMYWRYFMWNFAGRQNDVQGHGGLLDGNWLSGIDFIDNERLAPQDNLPTLMERNFAYNKFFMLPLALGILGLMFQLYRRPDDWLVTLLLFLFTGIAIVVYLNQTPYQPRERDYAYAGSFYAFAIWIGLGVYALYDAARGIEARMLQKVATYVLGAAAAIYLFESLGSGSHFMSYSVGFLGAVILAAMYLMHFLGKTQLGASALALLALAITLPVPVMMGAVGWDDHDRSGRYTARDFAANYLESCSPNSIIFTNGDNDTFPLWYAQEVEGIRTDVRVVNLSLLNTDWYINQMKQQAYESEPLPFFLDEIKYRQGTRDVIFLDESRNVDGQYVNVDNAMAYIADDDNLRVSGSDKILVLPTKNFYLEVPAEQLLERGMLEEEQMSEVVDSIAWRINRNYLLKNNMMQLDLLATNNWERDIYFAVTTGPDSYINLDSYFQLTGLAYRLTPIKVPPTPNPNMYGSVDAEVMYANVMNKFKWGGMDSAEQIYMDETNLRMTNNIRLQLANLADELITQEKTDKAKAILDLSLEVMPDHNVPFDRLMVPIIENYYKLGVNETANQLTEIVFDRYAEEFEYLLATDPATTMQLRSELQMSLAVIQRLHQYVTRMYPQEALREKIDERFKMLDGAFDAKIQELEAYRSLEPAKF